MQSIYKIECMATGRVYIGCTQNRIDHRIHRHLYCLKNNRHTNKLMQNDFNKYGIGEFKWQLLYISSPEITNSDLEKKFQILYKTYDDRYGYNGYEKYWRKSGKPTKALLEVMKNSERNNHSTGSRQNPVD